MKSLYIIPVAAMGFAANVQAADVYGGSIKDGPIEQVSVSTRGGLYVRGDLGIASGDRDMSRTISREAGLGIDTTGIDPADIQDAQDDLAAAGINSTLNGSTLEIPLIADRLGLSDSNDFSSAAFGGELMYLWRPGQARLGFSAAVGATFYSDSETSMSHEGATGVFTGGTVASAIGEATACALPTCAGDPSPFSQTGSVKFERDYDIDLIGRLHWFASDRLAFNVGAGVSFARASFSGANSSDPGLNEAFGTAFKTEDHSIGYVLAVGADYWVTDRITIGAEANYKHHEFDAQASNGDSVALGGPLSLYGRSNDSVEVEDGVWTIKGRIGIKLTD